MIKKKRNKNANDVNHFGLLDNFFDWCSRYITSSEYTNFYGGKRAGVFYSRIHFYYSNMTCQLLFLRSTLIIIPV
jgi:hypothetical protein